VTTLSAAVDKDGELLALRYDQLDDCGAYLRAPEPASLYRMHGHMTGAYKVQNLAVRNRVVLTNKTPTGLNRGFGGPQVYFALERLMLRIAEHLDLDPVAVIKRNLVPAEQFPFRAAGGSLLDSGNYRKAVDQAIREGQLQALRAKREVARAAGKLYGIGFAAVVEPSISNMGYITTVMTARDRRKAGPKGGAPSVATVAIDPLGAVSVSAASAPQGQGHRTVLAQVIADVLGLSHDAVQVRVEHDTGKDAWSIASGNYASRFSGAVAGAAHIAAMRMRERLARIAAPLLNVAAADVRFSDAKVYAAANPDNAIAFRRLVGAGHWAPGALPDGEEPGLRETAFWSMPELAPPDDDDRVNSSGAYGFIFDYCGVEVDPDTGQVRIDKYVTMHDAGRRLHPAMVDGQIRGGFAHAVGAALLEEFRYSENGDFLTGTFADYLVPTACEVPEPTILHMESPSPFTPLGAKGVGEGNCMSTPVCLANAVADAIGVSDIELPMTPDRIAMLVQPQERQPSGNATALAVGAGERAGASGQLSGSGEVIVAAQPEVIWASLLDPERLKAAVPGCEKLESTGTNIFVAEVGLGIGPVRGKFSARIELLNLAEPERLSMRAQAFGPLGTSSGTGQLQLERTSEGTLLRYQYNFKVGGKVAAIGGRMLEGTVRSLASAFFQRLGGQQPKGLGAVIRGWFGKGR
jgi:2-furoyl-CoA dehydrogenase large subunit